jgi:opacity protein-like surface antigen
VLCWLARWRWGPWTSQSYGVEAGVTVWRNLQVFVDVGHIRTVAPSELGASAQLIAAFLSQTQGPVSTSVKEPATFAAFGVRYPIPVTFAKLEPYVMGGFGFAKVSKDVAFTAGGTDITASLAQFGVVLGSDLSGSFTKPMVEIGGGVVWPIWQNLVIDFQLRYNHISAEEQDSTLPVSLTKGTSVGRAGIGVGIRF